MDFLKRITKQVRLQSSIFTPCEPTEQVTIHLDENDTEEGVVQILIDEFGDGAWLDRIEVIDVQIDEDGVGSPTIRAYFGFIDEFAEFADDDDDDDYTDSDEDVGWEEDNF